MKSKQIQIDEIKLNMCVSFDSSDSDFTCYRVNPIVQSFLHSVTNVRIIWRENAGISLRQCVVLFSLEQVKQRNIREHRLLWEEEFEAQSMRKSTTRKSTSTKTMKTQNNCFRSRCNSATRVASCPRIFVCIRPRICTYFSNVHPSSAICVMCELSLSRSRCRFLLAFSPVMFPSLSAHSWIRAFRPSCRLASRHYCDIAIAR